MPHHENVIYSHITTVPSRNLAISKPFIILYYLITYLAAPGNILHHKIYWPMKKVAVKTAPDIQLTLNITHFITVPHAAYCSTYPLPATQSPYII